MTRTGMILVLLSFLLGVLWVFTGIVVFHARRSIRECRKLISEGGDPAYLDRRIDQARRQIFSTLVISVLATIGIGVVLLPLFSVAL